MYLKNDNDDRNFYDINPQTRELKVDIQNYLDIPESIRSFKMYSHELIIDESNELLKNYSYTKVEANGITIYVRSICQKENTNEFINVLKQVYDFKLETIEDVG